jgi:integrase
MKVKFYLTRANSATATAIYLRISYKGLQTTWTSPHSVNPVNWNTQEQRAVVVKGCSLLKGEAQQLNLSLRDIEAQVNRFYMRYVEDNNNQFPTVEEIKSFLDGKYKSKSHKKEQVTLLSYFDEFVTRTKAGNRFQPKTGKPVCFDVGKHYGTTCEILKDFQQVYSRKIDFNTIDHDFYVAFRGYLTINRNLALNTIGDHIKRLKAVLNEATEKGLNTNLHFRSRSFAKPNEPTDNIYLTSQQVDAMAALDLSHDKQLEAIRDAFVIRCYNGIRFQDFEDLKAEQLANGRIKFTQSKTSNPVVIPIHPKAKPILARYNGAFPKSIDNARTNKLLKKIAAMIPALHVEVPDSITKGGQKITVNKPKWELVKTHTARRTFATNEYKARDIPDLAIMAITGHKSSESFKNYIKVTEDEHADMVESAWEKRYSTPSGKVVNM